MKADVGAGAPPSRLVTNSGLVRDVVDPEPPPVVLFLVTGPKGDSAVAKNAQRRLTVILVVGYSGWMAASASGGGRTVVV